MSTSLSITQFIILWCELFFNCFILQDNEIREMKKFTEGLKGTYVRKMQVRYHFAYLKSLKMLFCICKEHNFKTEA